MDEAMRDVAAELSCPKCGQRMVPGEALLDSSGDGFPTLSWSTDTHIEHQKGWLTRRAVFGPSHFDYWRGSIWGKDDSASHLCFGCGCMTIEPQSKSLERMRMTYGDAAPPRSFDDSHTVEEAFDEALKLEQRGDWAAAIAEYERIAEELEGQQNGQYARNCAQNLRERMRGT